MSDTTLYGLAKEMFDETGNAERAIAKMVEYIESDPKLYKALAAPVKDAHDSAFQKIDAKLMRAAIRYADAVGGRHATV